MKGRKLFSQMAAVAALAVLVAVPAVAAPQSLATVHAGASSVEWQPAVSGVGLALTVSGPQGFYLRQEFKPGESATFSVFDKAGQVRPAGVYTWELTPIVKLDTATAGDLQATRDAAPDASGALSKSANAPSVAKLQSGSFTIADQAIVAGGEQEPVAKKPARPSGNSLSTKDQVIADDLIVQGSECVGIDCVNNESFGFDTLRLKENNTRIKFDDTSTSSGFPNHDWELVANDSASGGANKFAIQDDTAGTVPLTITGSAPSNSIFVDSNGNVGFGTSTPVLDLHVTSGNTPALRLEQNNSSGFAAQTWDVAGNETNFFVRDVTNGSKLPFKIIPGAPTNSLYVNASGNVGVGTSSPDSALQVKRSTGALATLMKLTNNSGVQFLLERTDGNDWQISNFNASFQISVPGSATPQFSLAAGTGDLTIGGKIITTGPTCSGGCDRVLSPDFKVMPIEKHAAEMRANSYLPAVGPTRPGAPINLSEKTGGILNELEMAHIYIAQLNEQVKNKQTEISELKKELDALKETVNTLVDKK